MAAPHDDHIPGSAARRRSKKDNATLIGFAGKIFDHSIGAATGAVEEDEQRCPDAGGRRNVSNGLVWQDQDAWFANGPTLSSWRRG